MNTLWTKKKPTHTYDCNRKSFILKEQNSVTFTNFYYFKYNKHG